VGREYAVIPVRGRPDTVVVRLPEVLLLSVRRLVDQVKNLHGWPIVVDIEIEADLLWRTPEGRTGLGRGPSEDGL